MKKLLTGILTAVCAVSAAIGLTACGKNDKNDSEGWGKEYTVKTAYSKAVELGYDKSLEEFIATISGKDGINGVDGKDGINGTDGKDGVDGVGIKEVKFDTEGNLVVVLTDDTEKNLGKIPYCKHAFGELQTVLEATCTSIGYGMRECEACGHAEYVFSEAKGHTWNDGVEFYGKILKTCTVCSATKIEDNDVDIPDNNPGLPDDGSEYTFIAPVDKIEVLVGYEFAYNPTLDRYYFHQGIDFKCEEGTEVKAALDGTVLEVGENVLDGGYIRIEHLDGLVTVYKFIIPVCSDPENPETVLKAGDKVKKGDVIATVAPASGNEIKSGAHLHFEIEKNGIIVDPNIYLDVSDK